jgi:PAS domain S-box-containing protein
LGDLVYNSLNAPEQVVYRDFDAIVRKQPSFPLRRDLGSQLLAISLGFVALLILVAVFFDMFARRQLQQDVSAANLALAQAIAQETNAMMENSLETVSKLGQYPAVRLSDSIGMTHLFQTLMNGRNDINLTYRLDDQGEMQFHYPIGPESTVGTDFSFRDYFQQAQTSHDPLISKGRVSPTTNEPVATAVMPLWNEQNQFLGLVGTNLRLQSLSNTLTGIADRYGEDARFELFIVDHVGQTVAHSNSENLLQNAGTQYPNVTAAVLDAQSGTLIENDLNGESYLYSYVPIPDVGWGVIVGQPSAVAFATITAFRRGLGITVASLVALGILFWLALSKRVIGPLERLAEFSQNAGLDEQFSADSHRAALAMLTERPDQMGLLSRSLTSMQQAIEARLNEVSTLLETSAAVVSSLDQETVLNRILEQAELLLNVPMSAIFALDEQRGIFRVYASRGLPDWYTEQATISPDEPGSVTMRAIHSGGPIQVSDAETNPSFKAHRDRARRAGFRSVLGLPLPAQHTNPAALLVFRPDIHEFSPQEINLLATFANHAAMAVENSALYARSDMRLKEQTRRLESLIQSMQDGLILEDMDGRVLYVNRSMAEWSRMAPDEMTGRPVSVLMEKLLAQAHDQRVVREQLEGILNKSGERRIQFPLDLVDRQCHLRLILFDVTDPSGMPIGRGRILQDITQRYELDRMRSRLISTVSHELRTPLAAIKGYASTLLADDVQWDADSQQEFLRIISDETDHLSELVTDLLDMSRIEAGNLTVERVACELPELIWQAAQHAYPDPCDYLQVDTPSDLPPVLVDPQRIVSVLRNLIENALKYGGYGKPVHIRAFEDGDWLIVHVVDEGPGIDPEEANLIFDSFYRADNSLTREATGAGLGLAISRGFVRAHGGEVWIEPMERGLCVAFSLPLMEMQQL